ncbi:MAG: diguanylate cyclase, partial [Acidobacteria bacterium]|nr:diguanylate cyclase [Acidobacteriota bacterium]
ALGISVYEATSYSIKEWLILGSCTFIGLIVSQYNIRIPRTEIYFSIREPLIFWSVLWLGPGGGVLLVILSAIGSYLTRSPRLFKTIAETSSLAVTTLFSGFVFYLILNGIFGFASLPVARTPVNAFSLLGSLVIFGIFQWALYSLLFSTYLKFEGTSSVPVIIKENFLWSSVSVGLSVVAVFCFHLLIMFFGLLFGVLVLPVTVVAHFAYQFHRQMLAQKTKEIREANRIHVATVEALATAIDARDQVGRGHVTRAQIYAVGIGKILDLPNEEIQALSTGALLHDIGKLAVPDHILNKPGRLTPAEMEKMKIHPQVGAAILENVNFPYPVISTVKYHHESWDGSGYPEGLKKEEIPLTARILAVADAYDTLRGARPYRPSVTREDARRFLISASGTQFDPQIVDIFMRNLTKFEAKVKRKNLAYELDRKEIPTNDPTEERSLSYIDQIKRANREVFTLYELARVFSSSLSMDETLTLFAKKISELVPLDTCVIYLLDETKNVAIARHAMGKHNESLKNRKIKVGQGATGYTLKKRQPIYHINPGLDFSFYQMEFIQEYTSMASLPLIANEKLLGAVSLYSCELDTYEDEHMRLLETLARIASDAISTSLRHAETENRALTDAMTALPNGRSLQIQFEKEIARARRNNTNFQILMLDLDGFKAINDTFGHKAGDRLLKDISIVMRKQLRDYDFLARYAGDEFVAIIPETSNEEVRELCQRMEKAVRDYKLDTGNGVVANVGVSLGSATYPKSGETLDQLIIAADKAMYAVKGRRKAMRKRKRLEAFESRRRLEELRSPSTITVNDVDIQEIEQAEIVIPVQPNQDSLIVELDETHVIRPKKEDRPG